MGGIVGYNTGLYKSGLKYTIGDLSISNDSYAISPDESITNLTISVGVS